ncbi:MAG: ABC transporter ATP-binding protein/permease [Candidatus Riflebacteria bacterium]|nr:ABC transporter ATP-binding protein/permease [Candidatus Riflebacteria bacterium]
MIKTFKPYLQRFKWLLLLSYAVGILLTATSSLTPLAGKIFFDNILTGKPPEAVVSLVNNAGFSVVAELIGKVTTDVYWFALFAFSFSLMLATLQTIRDLGNFFIQQRMTAQITSDLFARVMHASLKKHQSFTHGYLNSRIMADSGAFEALARTLLPSLANNLLRFFLGLAILSHINLKMTLICLLTAPIYLLTNWFFTPVARRLSHLSAEKSAKNQAFVQNSLLGIETIKGFNLEMTRIDGLAGRLDELISTRFKYYKTGLGSSAIARAAQICCLLFLLVTADGLFRAGQLSVGDIIAFLGYIGYLAGPLSSLAMLYLNLQPTLASINRAKEVLEFSGEDDCKIETKLAQVSTNPVSLNVRPEKICLHETTYSHNCGHKILDKLNLEFRRGRVSVIDWVSGAGKTTLARLLLKFLRPDSGKITLDGRPLAEIATSALREIIGYKPQADFFFAGSIMENLLVANPQADENDILKALHLCCAEDFVLNYPDGLNRQLSDGATNLSEGQRQRLALVRTIIKDPGILILDEPFAAIDQVTAAKIMENLQPFMAERITIIMSHKKFTVDGN